MLTTRPKKFSGQSITHISNAGYILDGPLLETEPTKNPWHWSEVLDGIYVSSLLFTLASELSSGHPWLLSPALFLPLLLFLSMPTTGSSSLWYLLHIPGSSGVPQKSMLLNQWFCHKGNLFLVNEWRLCIHVCPSHEHTPIENSRIVHCVCQEAHCT